jgi:hypothetical protein
MPIWISEFIVCPIDSFCLSLSETSLDVRSNHPVSATLSQHRCKQL